MTDIQRIPPPTTDAGTTNAMRPEDYISEMAQAKMAENLIREMGTPTIVSKKFIVWHGIIRALNHTPENPTHLDTSLRLFVYDFVAKNSVNESGRYFNNIWAYLMKPKYIITQAAPAGMGNAFEEEEPGFFRRVINRVTGGGAKPNEQQ